MGGRRRSSAPARRVARLRGRFRLRSVVRAGGGEFGDGGRVGEDGTDGELASSDADAQVNVEGSLQHRAPVDARARGVKLALEDSVPVRERQDVRGDLLSGPP